MDEEEKLLSTASAPSEEQLLDAALAAQARLKTGYADGEGHKVLASQHQLIRDGNGQEVPDVFEESTKALNRETLKAQLALDASAQMREKLQGYAAKVEELVGAANDSMPDRLPGIDFARMERMAMDNPEKASAVATVEAVAGSADPHFKTIKAFEQYMASKVAEKVGDRPYVLGLPSYATDVAGLFASPFRTGYGMAKFGGLTGKSYLSAIDSWNGATIAEREQAFESLNDKLWQASGNNALVYQTLVAPFIHPSESKQETYAAIALDVLDTGGTTWGMIGVAKDLNKLRTAAGIAHSLGNKDAAGKAVASGVAKGDADSVTSGSAVLSKSTPVDGVEVPTHSYLVERLRKEGRLAADEDLTARTPGITPEEAQMKIEWAKNNILKAGEVIKNVAFDGNMRIVFDVERTVTGRVVNNVTKSLADVQALLKNARNEIKLLAADSKATEKAEEMAKITSTVKQLRKQEKELKALQKEGSTSGVISTAPRSIPRKIEVNITEGDLGKLEWADKTLGVYAKLFGTPETGIGKLINGFISRTSNLRQQQRRIFGYFDREVKGVKKKLSGDEQLRVDKVLLSGDRLQKRFSDIELRDGVNVDGIGHIRLNEKEIGAYNRMRDLYDSGWIELNKMRADELTFAGYKMAYAKWIDADGKVIKDIKILPKTSDVKFTVPVNRAQNKIGSVIDMRRGSPTKGMPVAINTIHDLDSLLGKGKLGFTELAEMIHMGDGSTYKYALFDTDRLGTLTDIRGVHNIDNALDYRKGYIPKLVEEQVRFVVLRPAEVISDGVKIGDSRMLRGFATESEAEIYLAQLRAKDPTDVAYKQELDAGWMSRNPDKMQIIDNRLFRGAFTGHRFEDGSFRIGLDGHEAERVSSYQSMQRYADFVAAYAPMHQFKQAMIKRFIKDVEDSGSSLAIPYKWDSEVSGSTKEAQRLRALQDQMKATFGVPTSDEARFNRFQNAIATAFERMVWTKDGKRFKSKAASWLPEKLHNWTLTSRAFRDPTAALRGGTFNLMLGSFNPAQLVVQTGGMLIPATTHPLLAMRSIPQFLYSRVAMHFTDLNAAGEAAKAVGLNGAKMKTMLHAWHRSGIPDSVLEQADFGHYAGTHGAYYSPSMINSIAESGRIFFNHGELNNRLFSFIMAFERKAGEHAWDLSKPLKDNQINEVVQEAFRIGMNLGAGNKAKWQDGITGLITQFWQVSHKYYENLFYGLMKKGSKENQWTKAETYTAGFMNALMFGAAGYGLEEWTGWLDRYMYGASGMNLNPDDEGDKRIATMMRGGLLETLSLESVGFAVDLSDRVGPASGLNQVYKNLVDPLINLWTDSDNATDDLGKMLLGATGTIRTRFATALNKTLRLLGNDIRTGMVDDVTVLGVASEWMNMTTSVTNLTKSRMWWHANDIISGNGKKLFVVQDGEEVPVSVAISQALGFSPTVKEMKELQVMDQKLREKEYADTVKLIMEEYRGYFQEDGTLVSPQLREAHARRAQFLLGSFDNWERKKVLAKLKEEQDKLYGPDEFNKKLLKALWDAEPYTDKEKEIRDSIGATDAAKL
jgi:hypothetical protein